MSATAPTEASLRSENAWAFKRFLRWPLFGLCLLAARTGRFRTWRFRLRENEWIGRKGSALLVEMIRRARGRSRKRPARRRTMRRPQLGDAPPGEGSNAGDSSHPNPAPEWRSGVGGEPSDSEPAVAVGSRWARRVGEATMVGLLDGGCRERTALPAWRAGEGLVGRFAGALRTTAPPVSAFRCAVSAPPASANRLVRFTEHRRLGWRAGCAFVGRWQPELALTLRSMSTGSNRPARSGR